MKKIIPIIIIATLLLVPFSSEAALRYTNSTDRVTVTANSTINSLNAWTAMMWVKPSAITAGREFFAKSNGISTGWFARFPGGTAGNVAVSCGRTTTSALYQTNNTPFASTTNAWMFIAVTCNLSDSAGQIIDVYVGSTTKMATEQTYGTVTDGSGGAQNDSAIDFQWGARASADAMQGDLAWGMFVNRELSLGEIRSLQFNPRYVSGCLIYHQFGFNRTGTQRNLCGSGNAGTVTGATVAPHGPFRSPFGF
jgi:Concanavalin A-like lectin/glucanases superfamily